MIVARCPFRSIASNLQFKVVLPSSCTVRRFRVCDRLERKMETVSLFAGLGESLNREATIKLVDGSTFNRKHPEFASRVLAEHVPLRVIVLRGGKPLICTCNKCQQKQLVRFNEHDCKILALSTVLDAADAPFPLVVLGSDSASCLSLAMELRTQDAESALLHSLSSQKQGDISMNCKACDATSLAYEFMDPRAFFFDMKSADQAVPDVARTTPKDLAWPIPFEDAGLFGLVRLLVLTASNA
jgi:hypothetical protein